MKKGFTLVELAIVLVIIGLLVGGVLAGQTLIKQAKINKHIRELTNLTTAWTTFYAKYNGIPGDLKNPENFFPVCDGDNQGGPSDIIGDGNKFVDNFEPICVWQQLAVSGLYMPIGAKKDQFGSGYPVADLSFGDGDAYNVSIWPVDKSILALVQYNDFNFVGLGARNNLSLQSSAAPFTPEDMYSIDVKIDDGKPMGIIWAQDGSGQCYNNLNSGYPSQTSEYNISNTGKVCWFFYKLQ